MSLNCKLWQFIFIYQWFRVDTTLYSAISYFMNDTTSLNKRSVPIDYNETWLNKTEITWRCRHYLACEFMLPSVDIEYAILNKGVLIIEKPDKKTRDVLNELDTIYASSHGHLPSYQIQHSWSQQDWLPGPQYLITENKNLRLQSCRPVAAHFLIPWEAPNSFHSLNDNVMLILANVVLQYVAAPFEVRERLLHTRPELYILKQSIGNSQSLIFKVLDSLFDSNIRPARDILTGGPHCIRFMSWSTSMKPFYRDSLTQLRRLMYLVIQRTLRTSSMFPEFPAPELYSPTVFKMNKNKNIPRVVIVTRNNTSPAKDASRRLTRESERLLAQAYRDRGAEVVICCNFRVVNTLPKLLSYFAHADICVGIHGAGLSNCVLAKEQMVLLELQVHHGIGFDSFMKIAHMANGTHIFYDTRTLPRQRELDVGIIISENVAVKLAELTLSIYHKRSMFQPVTKVDPLEVFIYNYKNRNQSIQSEQKFWIFPPPTYDSMKKKTILGPKLNLNEEHCKNLPYFFFRTKTMPYKEHRNHCDINKIYAKPSNTANLKDWI